jgi:lipoprotein-anchoring transpeptidase ErfK/SrfK
MNRTFILGAALFVWLAAILSPGSSARADTVCTSPEGKYIEVDLQFRELRLKCGDVVTAEYPIAVGKMGWETSRGRHTVLEMQEDPWFRSPLNRSVLIPPGPDNPLGDRWIGFARTERGVQGIHGTNAPDLVLRRAQVSHGCIRMLNAHVRKVYAEVTPGTPVIIF